MPALGVGALVFGVVQVLVSAYVYAVARDYRLHPPVVPAIAAFVVGVLSALVLGSILEVVVVELVLVGVVVGIRSLERGRSPSA